jgi:phosphatidylinositol-3-phosphatase
MRRFLTVLLSLALFGAVAVAKPPSFKHVVVVVLENKNYSTVVGNAAMPYFNGLGTQYGLATRYYANTHPSIGNYFMMTMGQVWTNNDGYLATINQDNVVRRLLTAGKTWKAYAESLPYAGWTGGDKYPYIKHHNPLAYYSDVSYSSVQKLNVVPFTQFASDLANDRLPNYSFLVPNQYHNAHDCPQGMSTCTTSDKLRAADNWLKANLEPLRQSPAFAETLLLVVWDEASSSDSTLGGGRVATVVVSPKAKHGYKSTTTYQHQSLLRLSLEALGVFDPAPAAGAKAPVMDEFFASEPAPEPNLACPLSGVSPSVTICSPGTTSPTSVRVLAKTTSETPVNLMQVYVDGVKKYEMVATSVDTTMTLATGLRRLTVQARNTSGVWFKSTVYVTVQ